ncbi:hypothetical protein SO802_002907 [Lithocarpus litseifolius]|uniref:Transmembrane protein n=1 Tax=Lithocarpus litseifolius TaxID=425828 RepID=A0AAW2E220_9ROSI
MAEFSKQFFVMLIVLSLAVILTMPTNAIEPTDPYELSLGSDTMLEDQSDELMNNILLLLLLLLTMKKNPWLLNMNQTTLFLQNMLLRHLISKLWHLKLKAVASTLLSPLEAPVPAPSMAMESNTDESSPKLPPATPFSYSAEDDARVFEQEPEVSLHGNEGTLAGLIIGSFCIVGLGACWAL